MKTILIGGFESGAFDQIARAFAPLQSDYVVKRVANLGQFQGVLDPLEGDLLILDMSGTKALEWLAAIADVRAPLPVLAVGDTQKTDFQEYAKRYPHHYFPQVDYIQEPFSQEALLASVNLSICDTAWGVIGGLSLSTLLQMIHMEKKTCTIRVISGRRQGFLYMRAGAMINARYRRTEGLEAAYHLLASQSPRAEISGQLHDSTHSIHASMEELLMEAARLQDELVQGEPMDAAEDEPDGLPSSEHGKWKPMAPAAPVKPTSMRGLLFGVVALVLLLAGLGLFVATRSIQIEVLTTPSPATVSLDGRKCGETPLSLSLPKSQGSLTLEAAGYQSLTYVLKPGDRKLAFTLDPAPRAMEAAPTARGEEDPGSEEAPSMAPGKKDAKPAPKPSSKSVPKAETKTPPKSKGDVFDQIRKS